LEAPLGAAAQEFDLTEDGRRKTKTRPSEGDTTKKEIRSPLIGDMRANTQPLAEEARLQKKEAFQEGGGERQNNM